ncbi:hypothetical protein VTG60DRAFT_2985 [Thermothelomyces hinnuleus]
MSSKHAPGTTPANLNKPSIANLPYELQVAIFEAAVERQIFFVEISNDVLRFSSPSGRAIGLACQLSREIYLKGKVLKMFGNKPHWLDPDRDIFYLWKDDPVPRANRPTDFESSVLRGDAFDERVVRNVAVDLGYLGEHPRHDAIVRIWNLFPSLRTLHILAPKGPPHTPPLLATPETLVLSDIPSNQVVAAPHQDRELWLAVRYQVKKVCARILTTENGWHGRYYPEVVGHLTSLWVAQSEREPEAETEPALQTEMQIETQGETETHTI